MKKNNLFFVSPVMLLLYSSAFAQSSGTTPLTQSEINQPNGVAGLDASGNVTASIKTPSGAALGKTDRLGAWAQIADGSDSGGVDPYAHGYEAALLGGVTPLDESGNQYTPRSLLIQSEPYGPYSAGCGIGESMGGSEYSQQFPISESRRDGTASAAVVDASSFDADFSHLRQFRVIL
ncbi:hypothetical protein [Acetobacter sicerae]|uniref:hypothetical protein n=1 Tax=Acetobacter sicerae TaxID=85325 RepID=UPI00156B68EC|nr:hypothetical protein [Acetobacter sicerae]NHN91167.1 hypothetical protein [Acetobacter sicerae]